MKTILRNNTGITLIELMIALTMMSSIVIAGLYQTFVHQQKTYTVQEQVVDMQQNIRASATTMISEIRMAGFGNISNVLPVNGFGQIITMNPTDITIVGGFKQIKDPSGSPITVISTAGTQITLSAATDAFDGEANKYISVGGLASYTVNQPTGKTAVLTLDRTPTNAVGANLYKIQAITYSSGLRGEKPVLQRDEHTGNGPEDLVDGIEGVQFEYLDAQGNLTADLGLVRMVRLTATARTEMSDPELHRGDGYRRRTISSNIQLRNLGLAL